MTASLTNADVILLTFALPNCAVAVADLPDGAGLWLRLHDGKTITIPPGDLPPDGDPVATGLVVYQACLARQRRPVA